MWRKKVQQMLLTNFLASDLGVLRNMPTHVHVHCPYTIYKKGGGKDTLVFPHSTCLGKVQQNKRRNNEIFLFSLSQVPGDQNVGIVLFFLEKWVHTRSRANSWGERKARDCASRMRTVRVSAMHSTDYAVMEQLGKSN